MTKKLKTNMILAASLLLVSGAGLAACVGIGAQKSTRARVNINSILEEYNYELKNEEYKNSQIAELEKKLESKELTAEQFEIAAHSVPDLPTSEFVIQSETIPQNVKVEYQESREELRNGITWMSSSVVFCVPFGLAFAALDNSSKQIDSKEAAVSIK